MIGTIRLTECIAESPYPSDRRGCQDGRARTRDRIRARAERLFRELAK
jgi:hypothetical protein